MKKLFALFLALTMVFSLAACGNSSGPSATTPDPTPSVDVDISGMEMLSGTIHFNDTYASTELYYSADKWVAKCVNKPASIDETVVGTINYEVLKLDLGAGDLAKAMLDELQALYDEKFGVTTLVDTIDFGVSAPEVTLRYSDRFWHAYFHVSDPAAGVNIEADLAGSIADGILELEQENTDGMAKALFLPPIQAYYTSVIGTTYSGIAEMMTGPNEMTIWYTSTEWEAKFYIADVNVDAVLGGTIDENGILTLVDDNTGGFGDVLVKDVQNFYYQAIGKETDVPAGATEALDVEFPDLSDMVFYMDKIDMNGTAEPDVYLGYSDDEWVLSYYFEPVSLTVFLYGTIENGKLAIQQASNAFANDLLDLFQALYEKALAADNNMKTVTGEVDFGGVATCPVVLHYNDGQFVLTYYFEVADKNVFITGTITDGNLAIVSDSTGTTANDLLPAFQTLYDQTT